MKTLAVVCLFSIVSLSCDIEERAEESCRRVIAEERGGLVEEAWSACTNYYEAVAIPLLKAEISMLYRALGCTWVNGAWDCTNTCITPR